MTDERSKRRNEYLDKLKSAADEWYKNETRRIQDEVEFMRSWMRGRTGSDRLAKKNQARSEVLAINDIGTFLTGDQG